MNEFKPMRVKHLYNVDIKLIIFVYFVVTTPYSKTTKIRVLFCTKIQIHITSVSAEEQRKGYGYNSGNVQMYFRKLL